MKLSDFEEKHESVFVVSSEVISNNLISKDLESNSDHATMPNKNLNSQSDEDDDDNSLWKAKKVNKSRKIIDDSSDEESTKDSEKDQESELSSAEGVSSDLNTVKSRIKTSKLDSDSEDEDVSSSKPVKNVECHSPSPESQPENKNNVPSYMSMFKNSDLYDAEGSSDEESQQIEVTQHEEVRNDAADEIQCKSAKKKVAPPRKSKQTALEEIHSETQRLVRQSRICLPYHQPKQRSLSEFLSRRKVPVIPLKTNSAQLSEVWMQIEEREKTVETFYKSESDSDEENSKIVAEEKPEKLDKDESSAPDKISVDSGIPQTNTSNLTLEETNFKNKEKEISNIDVDAILLTNDSAYCSPINSEQFDEDISSNKPVVENDTNKRDEKILEFTEPDSLKLQLTENTLLEISTAKVSDIDTEQDSLEIVSKSCEENDVTRQVKSVDQSESTLKSDKDNGMEDEVIEISAPENTEQFDSKKKIHNLLQNTLLDIKLDSMPRISGSPDSFIDLEEGSKKPGAFQLVTRFMKHAKLKPRIKKQEKMSVSVAEVNGKGEVISLNEEVINIKVGENSKPGETRMQLQAKLKEKIAQRREKEFVKRIEEYKLSEEMFEGETKDEMSEDEEVEEDFKISESSASESEPEENDMDITDKDKGDNPFLDEEAEESDNEGDEDEDDDDSKEKELDEDEDDVEEEDGNPEAVPLSTNIAQLLDIKSGISKNALQNTPNLGLTSGLTGLCSGGFPSQDLNLEDLEKNEKFTFEEPKRGLNLEDLEKNEELTFEEHKKITDVNVPDDASDEDSANEIDIAKPMEVENNADDSSDDEIVVTKPKRKKLRLTYSDDENDDPKLSENENSNESDEEVNEVDVNDSENENLEDVDEVDNNSQDGGQKEELDEDEDEEAFLKNPSVAAKRFFEDEAELSGSEYGSDDEDEADLDKYEKEDGDDDVFSKQNVHTELERLHMRYMLDDDKKEIRIIKELLFEDGELHSDGPKRQRQFKWYNQDENMFPDQGSVFDDEDKTDHPEEEEEDESWRKTRLERETYLQQLQDNDNAIGLKDIGCLKNNIIVKSSPKFSIPKANNAEFKSPNPRKQLTLITKRGSFLSRGEKVLSKIAEITNVASDNPVGNSRGKRSMVFAIVSPPKETEPSEQTSKRKNTDQPSTAAKRLKFAPVHLNKSKNSIFEKLKLHET